MGKQFRAVRKVYVLKFEDPEYAELEIKAKSVSFGELMEIADQAEMARTGTGLKEVRDLIDKFLSRVTEWNLANEEGVDTEKTYGAFVYDHDPDFVLLIVLTWFDAMTAVTGPLERRSPSGRQSPEDSEMTELQLANLPS